MDAFERLLQPVTVSDFMARHWGKATLHLDGSSLARVEGLPKPDAFGSLLFGDLREKSWNRTPKIVNASAVDRNGAIMELNAAPYTLLEELYSAGFSLCFHDLSSGHGGAALRELIRAARVHVDSGSRIFTTAYLTPPRSGGKMHFDRQHVFFCQVEGAKKWYVSRHPAVQNPPENVLVEHLDRPEIAMFLQAFGLKIARPEACDM